MKLFSKSPAVLAILLMFLTACDDPGRVGLDLVDDEGGMPSSASETLDIESRHEAPVTGTANNMLIGRTSDPLLGHSVTAHGHVGFLPPDNLEELEGQAIEGISLQFSPEVQYGDTTGMVDFVLRPITEAWEGLGLTADTSLAVGEVIQQYSVSVDEVSTLLELPDEWVAEHEDLFRDPDFFDVFYGFQLETVDGNAVLQFESAGTVLIVNTDGEENLTFGATRQRTFSKVQSTEPQFDGRTVIQNGTGFGARVDIELADTLDNHMVNRALIEIPADTVTYDVDGAFHRPRTNQLLAELSVPGRSTIVTLGLDIERPGFFSSAADGPAVRQFVQRVLVEEAGVQTITVRLFPERFYASLFPEGIPTQAFTMDFRTAFLFTEDAPDCPYERCTPRFVITSTPTN